MFQTGVGTERDRGAGAESQMNDVNCQLDSLKGGPLGT